MPRPDYPTRKIILSPSKGPGNDRRAMDKHPNLAFNLTPLP